MTLVRLQHVYKRYAGSVTAVSDFDLDIQDREFLVITGPSGCGKTTTLRMIAGLEDISQGNLYLGEQIVNDVSPKDRNISMICQSYVLYPHMNVYENMAFGLTLRKYSKEEIDKRIRDIAQILDITHLLYRKPRALSSGQRQRISLGRAIVRQPQVFLMDEPFSSLDAKLRVQMRSEIATLHKRRESTIIYATDDQNEAMTMGERVVVMKEGCIQQVASPAEIYHYPANQFVASYIGSPPMNFIPGILEEIVNQIYFVSNGFQVVLPQDKANIVRNKSYVGRKVIFGIRPEDFHCYDFLSQTSTLALDNRLSVVIEVVENMGPDQYIYFSNTQTNQMVAKLDAREYIKVGSSICIGMDLHKIHLFDNETKLAIFTK
ncbi:ABC transporter ATP-binding protein [Brevibacillus sp. VP]|uniref:ABC transporter ATP-binding protein n=1 Tax=unclassified Brevibacillus TaxID=2684853 RepID=UPI000E2F1C27|nr:ABC transporter ATP-binding protein [Brevibacillus sp. VP]RFB32645.1 ABC transporter ATP-binding protein [Brevibacillus sp. VP]